MSKIKKTTKIPSDIVLHRFEEFHPKNIRWDLSYKKMFLTDQKRSKAIYLKDGDKYMGEIILYVSCDNVVYLESITVDPQYQGQGYGTLLNKYAIEWAKRKGFTILTGDARVGASWNSLKSLGAVEVYINKNWSKTKEDYVHFYLEIK